MHTLPCKRSSSSSLESESIDLPLLKKFKPEHNNILFSGLSEDTVDGGQPESIGMPFGDLTQDLIPSVAPSHEMNPQTFEPLFHDIPYVLPINETSEISSDEDKTRTDSSKNKIQFPSCQVRPSAVTAVSSQHISPQKEEVKLSGGAKSAMDTNQKRQADRAARNRESSRRAREKAKKKFRALERDNINLHELVRELRLQNQHLVAQVDRLQLMQQSCPVCKFTTMAHHQQQHRQQQKQEQHCSH